jgi:hypothetical protein
MGCGAEEKMPQLLLRGSSKVTMRKIIGALFGVIAAAALSEVAGRGARAHQQSGSNSQASSSEAQRKAEPGEAQKDSQTFDIVFGGEVELGQKFEREIGHGLIFRLAPGYDVPESGWRIEISPKVQPGGNPLEFAWVATPPYHFANPLYLDTSYGTTAEAAVAMSPRAFHFVLSMEDFRAAADAVDLAIYSNNASEAEQERINRAAGKVEVGAGEVHILKSRLIAPEGEDTLGKIAWLKFEVKLKFKSGTTMQQILEGN